MRPLSSAELLHAWEQGLSEPASRRAVALLAAACPEVSGETVAAWSIGERDSRLLTLREWTFGSRLLSVANCSACGERLEWTVKASELHVAGKDKPPAELSLEFDQYAVSFRLPNSKDLAGIAECDDASAARKFLLEGCVAAARLGDQEIKPEDLPTEVVNAIVEQMAEADPQGDVRIDLQCPACGHRWDSIFDIESFFWSEINAWAGRILGEVHILASAYGWRESDILNLSPQRRHFYLGLVGG
jgi:hypothetical protein